MLSTLTTERLAKAFNVKPLVSKVVAGSRKDSKSCLAAIPL